MTSGKAFAPIAAAAIAAFWATAAQAQFGYYQLPKNDFVWNWGNVEKTGAKFEDFTVNGGEGGFNCELKAKFWGVSRMSTSDIRQLQDQLRARIDFIYASSNTMNDLDRSGDLEWARLACAKMQPKELTSQEKADREAKAREKMQREVDKRRAHQQPTE